MFNPLWHKRGFGEKSAVLWRSGHSRTFHLSPIVNYTENWSFPVSWWSRVSKIDKKSDTMRMFSPMWQKHGFGEKSAVLRRSGHSRTFHSTPIVNYTENRPIPVSWRREVIRLRRWQISCGCSVQSAEVGSTWSALIGSKNERSVNSRFHPPWVEHRILTSAVETVWHNPK